MLRILTVCVTFALAITGIPGSGLFDQPAWSQATTPHKDGPSVSRVKRLFETRTNALKKSRNLDQFAKLEKEIRSTKKIMSEQLKLIKRDGTQETQQRRWDIQSAIELLGGYDNKIGNYVYPLSNRMVVGSYRDWCMDKEAEEALAEFALLIEQIRMKAEAAKRQGGTVGPYQMNAKEWQEYYEESLEFYKEARGYKSQKCKEKKNVGDSGTGSETVTLPALSGPAPDTPEPTSETDFEADKLKRISENSAWLLGDWVYKAWRGGTTNSVLRFKLESDGSISGYLVSVTNEMAQKGFQPGMKLLRGIQDTSHTIRKPGNIWSQSAMVAETYSPKDPRRRPGQTYGQAGWFKSGVIFIDKRSGELGGSTGFQNNRLNWHRGTLVRPNLSSLTQVMDQLSSQVERLNRPGNEFERLEEIRYTIGQLLSRGRNSREAKEAANLIQLLLEREELAIRHQNEIAAVIDALESGQSESEAKILLHKLASHIVAQTSQLAQPISGNDYDGKIAANMFLVGVNGSKLRETMGNPSDARTRDSKSRLTRELVTLRDIAGRAGNSKDGTGQELMHGLRDLRSLSALEAAAPIALEIPTQTSAALLQQTATGFGHASNALKEVTRAIEGDPGAIQRAIGHANRLEQVLSGPGYYNAVKDTITNRIVNTVPFARTVVGWFK